MQQPLMARLPSGLRVPRGLVQVQVSHIKARTGAVRGANGPQQRLRRDQIGEKLEMLRRNSLRLKRESGKDSGPFQIKDWMK